MTLNDLVGKISLRAKEWRGTIIEAIIVEEFSQELDFELEQ